MDVLPGAIDEQFFLLASDECLAALAKLVDVGMSSYINSYFNSGGSNSEAYAKVHAWLDEPVKHVTFHKRLHNEGIVAKLHNINMDAMAISTNVQEMDELITAIDILYENKQYIHANIKPRKKDDYEHFLSLVPEPYRARVKANKNYFYVPNARTGSTGLAFIVARSADIDILYKGMKFRKRLVERDLLRSLEEVRFT